MKKFQRVGSKVGSHRFSGFLGEQSWLTQGSNPNLIWPETIFSMDLKSLCQSRMITQQWYPVLGSCASPPPHLGDYQSQTMGTGIEQWASGRIQQSIWDAPKMDDDDDDDVQFPRTEWIIAPPRPPTLMEFVLGGGGADDQ